MLEDWVCFSEILSAPVSDSQHHPWCSVHRSHMVSPQREGRGRSDKQRLAPFIYLAFDQKGLFSWNIPLLTICFLHVIDWNCVTLPSLLQTLANISKMVMFDMIQPLRIDSRLRGKLKINLGFLGDRRQVSKWLFGRQATMSVPWQLCSQHFKLIWVSHACRHLRIIFKMHR